MEYEIYKVQKEEKLKEIAEKYKISPDEIKKVNVNTHFFKMPFGSEYVGALQTLKIPVNKNFVEKSVKVGKHNNNFLHREEDEHDYDFQKSIKEREKELSKYKFVKFDLNHFEERNFVSNHTTEIYVNGGKMASYTQFQKFILQLLEIGTQFKISLNVYDNNFDDGFNLKEQFDGLLEKIVKLKDQLELSLNQYGKIEDVFNKAFLRTKWEEFKKDLKENSKLKEIPKDKFKEMIDKGNLEFSDSYPLAKELQKSIFHSYLFYPLYNQKYYIGIPNQLGTSWIMSTLFSQIKIPLTSVLDVSEDDENNEYIIKIESQFNKSALSRSEVEKAYKKNYPFLKEPFAKYYLEVNAFYAINKDDCQINFAEIEITEITNHNLEAYQKLEIERMPEDNPIKKDHE